MILATMKFGDYEWRRNPLSIKIENRLSCTKYALPEKGEMIFGTGSEIKVCSGKGEFSGDDCIEQYRELENVFYSQRKGILTIPGREPVMAYFSKLSVEATDVPQLLSYSFEFLEEPSDVGENITKEHICTKGETLYDIAFEHRTTVQKLVALNSQIKRPDELIEGEMVRLC